MEAIDKYLTCSRDGTFRLWNGMDLRHFKTVYIGSSWITGGVCQNVLETPDLFGQLVLVMVMVMVMNGHLFLMRKEAHERELQTMTLALSQASKGQVLNMTMLWLFGEVTQTFVSRFLTILIVDCLLTTLIVDGLDFNRSPMVTHHGQIN